MNISQMLESHELKTNWQRKLLHSYINAHALGIPNFDICLMILRCELKLTFYCMEPLAEIHNLLT